MGAAFLQRDLAPATVATDFIDEGAVRRSVEIRRWNPADSLILSFSRFEDPQQRLMHEIVSTVDQPPRARPLNDPVEGLAKTLYRLLV